MIDHEDLSLEDSYNHLVELLNRIYNASKACRTEDDFHSWLQVQIEETAETVKDDGLTDPVDCEDQLSCQD